MENAKGRMDVAADLRQARTLIQESMRRLRALPEDDRPTDSARATKKFEETFVVLDTAIDEVEA